MGKRIAQRGTPLPRRPPPASFRVGRRPRGRPGGSGRGLGPDREDEAAPPALDLEGRRRQRGQFEREDRLAALAADPHAAPSPLSSPNAVCSARTASSAYFSSMRQLTLISLVEMTRMFTPSSASTWNILAATPAWLRIPTPTMETFAIPSSWSTFPAPMALAIF